MASLIKQISEINSVCGNEAAIRNFILERIKADEITVDTMGNIIALKKGRIGTKKLMIASHMDESGFIVSGITNKGYIKFKPVGNIDPNTIISKRVIVGENKVSGIIGMKAIHLQTKEERENTVAVKKLFIDIGAKSANKAKKLVSLGDFITFDTKCESIGRYIKGKALSRAGLYPALKIMEKPIKYDTYFVFTSQKEIGMRGAEIISRRIEPDVVITIGTAASNDMYKCDQVSVRLGGGPVLSVADKYCLHNSQLTEFVQKAAERLGIKYQKAVLKHEFSDSGALQTGADGAVVINLSVPCRYAKTPVEMVSIEDLDRTAELLVEIIGNI